ncbi:ABC transporter substrate-binding protein [Paenibacillus eucommiae]|uniref:Multiple sugar transport system substrate-binding protein n=1 Tax=Paenibacillus eucommiae TaxID=1355755 RepID=A0ABS4J615_9BACL|nr:sugar ABC transporter substrate-binding protein [Paenibacillus eucommiae]MBP1994571.1 multiple sugar transport system substrate-binding protein [Paenibacillus eucommiae]
MKKTMSLCLMVIISIIFSACGTTSTPKDTPATQNPINSNTASPAQPKEVALKIGLPGAYDVTKKEIIDGFKTKYPYIKLEIEEAPWGDFATKITPELAGGTPPDVWFQENAVILSYGKRGVAEDLMPYIEKDLKLDDYTSALFAAKTEDGKVWGIPHGLNPSTMIYNKKLFDDAKIPYPTKDWTYEQMLDIARKLTKDTNGDGKSDVYGLIVTSAITSGWFPWAKSAGGGILDETKTKAIVDDPKTIEGLKQWVDTMKTGLAPTPDVVKVNGGGDQMFGQDKVAMMPLQYSAQAGLNKNFPDLDYDALEMPIGWDGKRVVPLVTNSWVIFSKAKQEVKDAAWEFLKYYLSDEAQQLLAASGAALPVKKSAMEKLDVSTKPQNKLAYANGVEEAGITTDENASWQEWRLAAQPIFTDMYNMVIAPEEGAKRIQTKIQDVLDRNK